VPLYHKIWGLGMSTWINSKVLFQVFCNSCKLAAVVNPAVSIIRW